MHPHPSGVLQPIRPPQFLFIPFHDTQRNLKARLSRNTRLSKSHRPRCTSRLSLQRKTGLANGGGLCSESSLWWKNLSPTFSESRCMSGLAAYFVTNSIWMKYVCVHSCLQVFFCVWFWGERCCQMGGSEKRKIPSYHGSSSNLNR